jgi:hypothetical protein
MKVKGVTLLSNIFLFIMILVLMVLMGIFIWAVMLIQGVEAQLGISSPRNIELTVLFKPVDYDTTLLSFLETEYQGVPMKRIINAVAIQETTDVWIEGKNIDVKMVSEDFLKIIEKPYLLKIRDPEIILAENEKLSLDIQKVSTNVFLLNGDSIDLELYVGEFYVV